MIKTYVLDTNVLLHNAEALFAFQENDVVIPFAVVEEIDSQKQRQDEVGRNARFVSQTLDQLRNRGSLAEGVQLPQGGTFRIELNYQDGHVPGGFDPGKRDHQILALANHLAECQRSPVILVTRDLGLRIKAHVLGVSAEDFSTGEIGNEQPYAGVRERHIAREEMEAFFREGKLRVNGHIEPFPHEFFILKNCSSTSQSGLARYQQNALWPLVHGNAVMWGVRALNKEQKFALELLLNDQIKVVTLVGRAGTGKTLLALAAGLEKVLEERVYSRLLVTRPVVPLGNDLGYLPGTKEDKLRPWMQPIYDNLEFLFHTHPDPREEIQEFVTRGLLVMEALTYIRGRSIPKQFILCDEAQNLSPHMIKTLITRVGEGTKIVFTGDPDQIDHPYLDWNNSGLSYLVERMKGEELAGHVTLTKGERSKVAELGARLFRSPGSIPQDRTNSEHWG